MFYKIQPASPGLFGADSVGDLTIPTVEKLHFVFLTGYLEAIVCEQNQFLASTQVQQRVMALVPAPHSVLFTRENLIVTTDDQFDILWPDLVSKVSDYFWMKVSGVAGQDDFGIIDYDMVVSERIWNCLKDLPFEHAIVVKWPLEQHQ